MPWKIRYAFSGFIFALVLSSPVEYRRLVDSNSSNLEKAAIVSAWIFALNPGPQLWTFALRAQGIVGTIGTFPALSTACTIPSAWVAFRFSSTRSQIAIAVTVASDKTAHPRGAQSGQDDVEGIRTLAGTAERPAGTDQLRRDPARSISLRHA